MAITPAAQTPQLLYFRMLVLHIVFDRQSSRIVDSDIATQPEEDAGSLKGRQA